MFNKRNEPVISSGSVDSRQEPSGLRADPPPPVAASRKGESSVIGQSLLIQGDMTGEEDLVINGRVEGSVSLKKNLVTIGKEGRANATVNAQSVRVEGTVEGELRGREQVIVTQTGSVNGNIVAPRVTLEDGCRFKGSIDMEGSDAGGAGKLTDGMLGASVADKSGSAKSGNAS